MTSLKKLRTTTFWIHIPAWQELATDEQWWMLLVDRVCVVCLFNVPGSLHSCMFTCLTPTGSYIFHLTYRDNCSLGVLKVQQGTLYALWRDATWGTLHHLWSVLLRTLNVPNKAFKCEFLFIGNRENRGEVIYITGKQSTVEWDSLQGDWPNLLNSHCHEKGEIHSRKKGHNNQISK